MSSKWALGAIAALAAASELKRRGSRDRTGWATDYSDLNLDWDPRPTRGAIGEFYPKSARDEVELYYGEVLHRGNKVAWPGTKGYLVPVDPQYAYPIEGNIFDRNKIAAVAQQVKRRTKNNPLVLRPGYGQFFVVDRGQIQESLQYAEEGGLGRPYTTGDEELDYYLANLPQYGAAAQAAKDRRLEKELKEAAREGQGDFGALAVQVRDGNHRTFGAAIGGEDVVWIRLYDNQLQSLREDSYKKYPHLVKLRKAIKAAQRQYGMTSKWPKLRV